MKTITKRFLPILLSLLIAGSVMACFSFSSSAEIAETASSDEAAPKDTIEGGLILHCWCWNFNNIKENIPRIAEAGYAAVQTSPINAVIKGDNGGMELYGNGKWYYQYQPTNYTIGNYQLGTEAEFKEMCAEAHKYGVKVIVDVVANHTASDKSKVDPSLIYIEGGLYHDYDGSKTPDERKSVTQWYSGLPDVNTQNPNYQQRILKYLKSVVADGADGFRYDTAKHIELPDDDEEFASDFWPTVLDNGSEFQYGEVLQGLSSVQKKSTRYADYAQIMHITASSYGYTIRKYLDDITGRAKGAVASSALALANHSNEGADDSRLVTWVESHDTYANGDAVYNPGVSSYWLTNEQIRRGWAIIVGSSDTTSLFFSRPEGSSPSTSANRSKSTIWGTNKIGNAGDENYFDPEVVEFNKFHNLMKGESSEVLNVDRNKAFVIINRGDKGVALVNSSPSADMQLSVETKLPQGTYTDHVSGLKFVSENGILTGSLAAGKTAVLYNSESYYTPEIQPATEATQPATEATQPVKQTTLELQKTSASLYVKQTCAINFAVKNSSAKTTFTSSNKKVATVTSGGLVKAVKKGKAVITVANNGVKKTFTVTVKNPKLNKKSVTLKKGKTFKIKVTGLVGKAKFKSSKKKVAKVSKTGKITAKKKGKATITVTANGIKLKLKVNVKKK